MKKPEILKVFNFIGIAFLILMNRSSFKCFFLIFKDLNTYIEKSYIPILFFPPELIIILNTLSILIGMTIIICSIGMFYRNITCRRIIVVIIPIMLLISVPFLFKNYLDRSDRISRMVSIIVNLITVLIYISLYFLYKSKQIVLFFSDKTQIKIKGGISK